MFSLAEIEVAHDPHIFYPRPNVGQECLVIATMKMFPDFEADQLPCAPHRNRLLIRMPDSYPTLPEYILTRHDDAVSGPRVRSINADFEHSTSPNRTVTQTQSGRKPVPILTNIPSIMLEYGQKCHQISFIQRTLDTKVRRVERNLPT